MKPIIIDCQCGQVGCYEVLEVKEDDEKKGNITLHIHHKDKPHSGSFISFPKEGIEAVISILKSTIRNG